MLFFSFHQIWFFILEDLVLYPLFSPYRFKACISINVDLMLNVHLHTSLYTYFIS